ncbi:MAG: hypothetical protein SFU98_06335 [Leptospiraceae bacterium]|nr:hypothetical protein [Leptospiraceae bacterium]
MQVNNDIRSLHARMGKVNNQPIKVYSYTNKRFTVNFRLPLEQLRKLVPEQIELDEIENTGLGMFSMCACDFWVSQLGLMPIPKVRNNDMLFRISVKILKGNQKYRAYYTLRSDSSSHFLGFFGKRFSHFRKQISNFERIDNGEIYSLKNDASDPLCKGNFTAKLSSINKDKPSTTIFENVDKAKQFIFDLDGSCGFSYERQKLSFQKIDYPPWDMYFCHDYEYNFELINYLNKAFNLTPEFDCVLFMKDTKQTWGSSWLY